MVTYSIINHIDDLKLDLHDFDWKLSYIHHKNAMLFFVSAYCHFLTADLEPKRSSYPPPPPLALRVDRLISGTLLLFTYNYQFMEGEGGRGVIDSSDQRVSLQFLAVYVSANHDSDWFSSHPIIE